MNKRRKQFLSVLFIAFIVFGIFTGKTQAAGKTVYVLGGAYKLTEVTKITSEKIKNLNGTTISVKKYKVGKGAKLTRVKTSSVWGANLIERGNESGDYPVNAKVDGRKDWIGDYLSNSYKSIVFHGNAAFRFQYERNPEYLDAEEEGKGYYVRGARIANTIIIQSGTGKGNYTAAGKAEYANFSVNGKTNKIPQYLVNYNTVYSIHDIAALFSKGKSPFTYQVKNNKVCITAEKKSTYKINKITSKKVKSIKENIKLTNTITGQTAEVFAFKINGSYCFSLSDLLPFLDAEAEIYSTGGKSVTMIESFTAPLKDGRYNLKTIAPDKSDIYQLKKNGTCWYTITNVKSGLMAVVTEQGKLKQKETPSDTDEKLFRVKPLEQGGYVVMDRGGNNEWWFIESE